MSCVTSTSTISSWDTSPAASIPTNPKETVWEGRSPRLSAGIRTTWAVAVWPDTVVTSEVPGAVMGTPTVESALSVYSVPASGRVLAASVTESSGRSTSVASRVMTSDLVLSTDSPERPTGAGASFTEVTWTSTKASLDIAWPS